MSEQTKGGGPAFPVGHPEMAGPGQTVKETQGMTLRDYFAAKAMQGLISACDSEGTWTGEGATTAEQAYIMADQMLDARDTDTTER